MSLNISKYMPWKIYGEEVSTLPVAHTCFY